MPAKGRIDISVKFSGVPIASPYSKGLTRVEVFCEDGYMILADVKIKTFKRFLESARRFDYWEGVVSGKLRHIQGHQLVLTNAGLQCHEKKPKVSEF